ncbi:MAG TPA: thiolase family protein, partial [Acidimicrobiales bacterium]|nr:thiolase family protein [Acidimicrobiales bacterium]
MQTRDAVIVDAVRTPIGKRNGALAGWHPADLLGHVLQALLERAAVDPALVDDVVAGCVTQVGEQSTNVARNAWVAAGLPWHVPATTVDRQCGSSQQAVHFVAQGVLAGAYDLAIACGVESMTRTPLAANARGGSGPFSADFLRVIDNQLKTQFEVAQILAGRWKISREDMDAYALESHRRAAETTDSGHFAAEVVPVPAKGPEGEPSGGMVEADQGIRRGGSMAALGALPSAASW